MTNVLPMTAPEINSIAPIIGKIQQAVQTRFRAMAQAPVFSGTTITKAESEAAINQALPPYIRRPFITLQAAGAFFRRLTDENISTEEQILVLKGAFLQGESLSVRLSEWLVNPDEALPKSLETEADVQQDIEAAVYAAWPIVEDAIRKGLRADQAFWQQKVGVAIAILLDMYKPKEEKGHVSIEEALAAEHENLEKSLKNAEKVLTARRKALAKLKAAAAAADKDPNFVPPAWEEVFPDDEEEDNANSG